MYILRKWLFNISPYKCTGTQIWSCRKQIKGQSTVNIWTNCRSSLWCFIPRFSLETVLVLEKILRVLLYVGLTAILINGSWSFVQIFNPNPFNRRLHRNLMKIGQEFQRRYHSKVWTDDGRTTMDGKWSQSLIVSLWLDELKRKY